MAEHLLSNVYQVGGGSFTHELDGASYLLLDPYKQEHVLIDCGNQLGYKELTRQLNTLDIDIGRIAMILTTHGHIDHIGAATHFKNIPIYLHENEIDGVLKADRDKTATFLYHNQTFPSISNVVPIGEGYEAAIGKTKLSVIHTPGHSRGSVCYKLETDEGTILIAGDTLWGGYSKRMESDFDDWESSLERLAQDHFEYLSFGHGTSRLNPNAMKHIDKARAVFCQDIQPSHNGQLLDPWAAVWNTAGNSSTSLRR